MPKNIKNKERDAIIQSLKSGVVPRLGLRHIQVGRSQELSSLVKNIENIKDGGNAFRFVIGEYGSGKTFFLQLVKSIALEKGLVTINADLAPNKRLHASDGQARTLFSELINSASTRTKKDGNALDNILERFINSMIEQAKSTEKSVSYTINQSLLTVKDHVGGYDFATVIEKYWIGYETCDDNLKNCAVRWLKAEYTTKGEALRDLGVRTYINDAGFYDYLKLFSVLVKLAGYEGLLVCIDEMVNLYKLTNSTSRKSNYEEILRMLNDSLQGATSNIGFILGGTPEFLTDTHRGLYSYEALKSRLAENTFAKQLGITDYNSTVLRLSNLSKEELYLLLKNLRYVFAYGDEQEYLVPDDALVAFLNHCANKIGDSYFRTPRNTIKEFLNLLSILEQHPDMMWSDIIEKIDIRKDIEDSALAENTIKSSNSVATEFDEDFATIKI
ncbi:MAG TPA: ATP-binding protein [Prolixibacteraceae bacterium]|nr:ATP-binding protein [Prolixibacteraceae bacterium]